MRRESIKIQYPGSEISVNHYLGRRKGGGSYVKPEAKAWIEEFQWLLKKCHLEDFTLPLHVTCSGYFKDEKSAPDLSNLSKVIMDSIEELIGVNDKDFRWHDGDRIIGVKEPPYLLIVIKEGADDIPKPLSQPPQSISGLVRPKVNRSYRKRVKQ